MIFMLITINASPAGRAGIRKLSPAGRAGICKLSPAGRAGIRKLGLPGGDDSKEGPQEGAQGGDTPKSPSLSEGVYFHLMAN